MKLIFLNRMEKLNRTLVLLLVAIISFFHACKKEEYHPPSVSRYIEELSMGTYDRIKLPAFTVSQISELLYYRDDTRIIRNFPSNPLSSYYLSECRLGIYILWTIEYIREKENGNIDAIVPWPSLSPVLTPDKDVDLNKPEYRSEDTVHTTAADAYFNWWQNSERKGNAELLMTNPLNDTGLRWW
jgi:hypothetical protein